MGRERLKRLLTGSREIIKGELWVSDQVLESLSLERSQYSLIEWALVTQADCCFFSYTSTLAERRLAKEEMEQLVKAAHLKNLGCGIIIDGPFERMLRDLGFMEALPLFAAASGGKTVEILNEYAALASAELDLALRAGAELVLLCDDVAYSGGLYLSPVQFQRMLVPVYQDIMKKTDGQVPLGFHSDGNIEAILPSLVNLGFSFFSLEPEAMDLIRLKSSILSKAILMCGIKAEWLTVDWGDTTKGEIEKYIKALAGETGLFLSSTCGIFLPSGVERLQQIYKLVC